MGDYSGEIDRSVERLPKIPTHLQDREHLGQHPFGTERRLADARLRDWLAEPVDCPEAE